MSRYPSVSYYRYIHCRRHFGGQQAVSLTSTTILYHSSCREDPSSAVDFTEHPHKQYIYAYTIVYRSVTIETNRQPPIYPRPSIIYTKSIILSWHNICVYNIYMTIKYYIDYNRWMLSIKRDEKYKNQKR